MKRDNCYNITKEGFKTIRQGTPWKAFLRKFEIDKILDGFAKEHFDRALELGCGDGRHSKYLASYCKKLFALEYNESRLAVNSDGKTAFVVGDAQDLWRFGDSEMDLIFSSNLIEHLPQLARCLAECRRVTKPEGLIIHTVPNRTWKFFHLLLYYPFGIKVAFWRLVSPDKSASLIESVSSKTAIDSSLRPLGATHSLKKNLLPKVHGIGKSHFSEFRNWGEKHWINIFENNGLKVVKIVRLPFYFGWDYNFRIVLRLGNYLGLSSSTTFVLRKIVRP